MSIKSLDDVRPGDFMIAGQSSAPAKLLVYSGQFLMKQQFRIGSFAAGHVAVITPGGKLVEAMPHGARERDIRETDWSFNTAFIRLSEDYPNQHLDAASIAQAMIGIRYSIASYAYIAAYLRGFQPEWLAKHIDRRQDPRVISPWNNPTIGQNLGVRLPVEAICSVLAEQAWTLTGKSVVHGTRPQVVTPGMLTGQLWNRDDVLKGAAWFL